MDNIKGHIKDLYRKTTYLDKYGGSVVVTGLIFFIFFLVFSWLYIQSQLKPIKADWQNMKCHPAVIPFAGIINAGQGASIGEFTSTNFAGCMNTILRTITGYFTAPIYFASTLIARVFSLLASAMDTIRKVIAILKLKIMKIIEHIFGKLLNVTLPFQKMIIKLKDTFGKMSGVMLSMLYTTMGAYLAMKAFIGAFLTLCIIVLIVAVAAIIILWLIPFTWPAAIAGTTFFVAISIPIAITAGWMTHILNIVSKGVPKPPGKPSPPWPFCFDESTQIQLKNGDFINIKDIKIGNILKNNEKVTATLKLHLPHDAPMYQLGNTILTGSHYVYHSKLGWIETFKHPDSKIITNYNKPFVYCINTTSKRIMIDNFKFMDWDEIEARDINYLKKMNYIPNSNPINIHNYLDSGFSPETLIQLQNGFFCKIKDLKIGDILKNGEKVLGTVHIDGHNLKLKKYFLNKNCSIIGGPNLFTKFNTNNLAKFKWENANMELSSLYHILTDTTTFNINNIKFYDYNAAIENIIDMKDTYFKDDI
jgi:hypothetical protein